jgi:23S rRNA (adenine2503-C2)-methyltransferase
VRAGGKRVTFEYTMIAGVNDDPAVADALADLVGELRPLVNLIPMNPIPFVDWGPSAPATIARFRARLVARGVKAEVREPRGRDIAAACGQLRNAAAEPGRPVSARA